MIIRVQSSAGTKKFEVSELDNWGKLVGLISSEFGRDNCRSWYLSTSHDDSQRINSTASTPLSKLGLKHGDILFMINKEARRIPACPGDVMEDIDTSVISKGANFGNNRGSIVEDKLDQELAKMDGRIKRKRNEQLCHHPPSGQCIHCVPLEPFDAAYLEHLDPPVKFMSFHAYLRKLSGGKGKGKFTTLENLSCRIRPGCREHPPWPDGICTKCQPSPVTLEVQPYRHVDYVQFENGQMMETFLDYWRQTGRQRIGLMLGRYAHFDTAGSPPLAIKAVVAAIYEPLQESTERSVRLTVPLDTLMPSHVAEVARRLDLVPVGWIFTDLVAEDQPNQGAVKHYRGTIDTFFLSAEECVTAAHLQNLYPNICCHSSDGHFGSKFVTVVVTGDPSNNIHFEAYQVSNQAMALERDNILVPTYDAPEFGYIRETTKEQFVPEVFYTLTDKYGNRVTRIARPLPVEYLLIDMPAAFPIEPVFTMAKLPIDITSECRFPVENRESIGQIQDFSAFVRLLTKFGNRPLYSYLANFHLLTWLAGNDSLPLGLRGPSDLDKDGMSGLLEAISISNRQHSTTERLSMGEALVDKWAAESACWATVLGLVSASSGELAPTAMQTTPSLPFDNRPATDGRGHADRSVGSDPMEADVSRDRHQTASTDDLDHWACQYCTFHNPLDSVGCEMCGLPQHA